MSNLNFVPENPRKVCWMVAEAPDKGAGKTNIRVFIQASSKDEARKILSTIDSYNVYDFSEAQIYKRTLKWADVAKTMLRVGGPNEAVDMAGNRYTRSDLE